MRRTGIDVIGDAPWGTHWCQFYESKQDLLDILVPYFRQGLADSEFCMWVTAEPLSVAEAKATLKSVEPAFDTCLRRGQIEILDCTQWYTATGQFKTDDVLGAWIEKLQQALEHGYEGMRIAGDAAGLGDEDPADLAAYEQTVNRRIGKYPMLAICSYPLDKCGAADIMDVVSNHRFSLVKRAGQWRMIENSEHRRTEAALRASERRLRLASSAAQLGVFEWDVLSDITHWENARMFEIFGRTPEQGPLSRAAFYAEVIDPHDRTGFEHALTEAMQPDKLFHARCRIRRYNDGQQRWTEWSGRFDLTPDGSVRRLVGVVADVTERKQAEEALRESEERFRMIFDGNTDGMVITDPKSKRFLMGNETICKMLGYTPQEITTMQVADIHPREDMPRVAEHFERLAGGEQSTNEDIPVKRKDGSIFFADITANSITLSGKTYLVGSFRDITERKRAREELVRARDELEHRVRERTAELHLKNRELRHRAEQLSRLASELTLAEQRERHRLAKVLHDHLQQLLAAAKIGLQGLAQCADDDEQGEAISDVYKLIKESIAASRSLTVELSPTILHEAGLAAGLQWLARWMEEKHGLLVDLRCQPEAAAEREDIRILLFESVRELLFNVVKHAGVTSARVCLARRDTTLEIVVSDEGVGFDPRQMHPMGREIAGGFGLFTIRERLELLGGSMKIEAAPQGGTKFTLIAPAVYPPQAVEPKIEQARRTQSLEPPRAPAVGTRLRILIVDDHSILRQTLAVRLKREPDIEIAGEAANGAEAVDQARQLRPDVILMDYSMPRMDGVEATRRIHAEHPHIRIVGLSMYQEADRAQAMLDAGASVYITKTANLNELLKAIRSTPNAG